MQGLKNGQVSTDDECEKKVFKDDFKDFGLSNCSIMELSFTEMG